MVAYCSTMKPRTCSVRVSASEARRSLATLLDRVSAGEEFVITRHGSPIATLRACDAAVDPRSMQRAIDGILELRSEFLRQGPGMTLEEIRTGIAADRK